MSKANRICRDARLVGCHTCRRLRDRCGAPAAYRILRIRDESKPPVGCGEQSEPHLSRCSPRRMPYVPTIARTMRCACGLPHPTGPRARLMLHHLQGLRLTASYETFFVRVQRRLHSGRSFRKLLSRTSLQYLNNLTTSLCRRTHAVWIAACLV